MSSLWLSMRPLRRSLPSAAVARTSSRHMSARAKKRFYRDVSVVTAGDSSNFELVLDSRKLRTPLGNVFRVHSEPLAWAAATEWKAQKKHILTSQMHITGLCNACIDNPTNTTKEVIADSVLGFLDTDTVLFFANDNEELLARQRTEWQPVLDWFCERFGVDLRPSVSSFAAGGGTAPDSLAACKDVMRKHLLSHGMCALQGVAFGVDALKSVVIAMAVFEKRLTVENAVALARLEVQVQIDRWGTVEWAHDLEKEDTTARLAAAAIFVHMQSNQQTTKIKE